MTPIPEANFLVTLISRHGPTPIKSVVDSHSKWFYGSDLANYLKIVNCKCADSVRVLNLCLDPISMNSVLVTFSEGLLSANCEHFLSLDLDVAEYCLHLSPAYAGWVSLAYILGSLFDRQFVRSFMYNKNSSGPKIVPWEHQASMLPLQVSERVVKKGG